ncbi:uncharacterized protein LOC135432842 isoform X3 [Drosophila montana]|uniref:uncharacterized protein LOC135432842 isoform X3 n=1 Tax=Drosophila montana TaxID=40370 RepID=UPI00313BBC9A
MALFICSSISAHSDSKKQRAVRVNCMQNCAIVRRRCWDKRGPFRKCSLMNHKPNQQNNQQSTKHKHLKTKPKRQQLGLDRNEGLASTPFQHSWHLTLERRKMDESISLCFILGLPGAQ